MEILDEVDGHGRTALIRACYAKDWDTAKKLIASGANVDIHDKV